MLRTTFPPVCAQAHPMCAACKGSGGTRLEIYFDIDAGVMRRKHSVIAGLTLRSALTDGGLRIYAQKIVSSMDSSETHGIECPLLLDGGAASIFTAGELRPDAKRSRMLQALGEWVIYTIACNAVQGLSAVDADESFGANGGSACS